MTAAMTGTLAQQRTVARLSMTRRIRFVLGSIRIKTV
jgi:hypothetical protein